MSDFSWSITTSSSKTTTARVLEANFGDGYSQRVADGINYIGQEWNISVVDVNTTVSAIESFLETKGGYTSFTWTPPDQGASEISVICKQWSRSNIGRTIDRLEATFTQVFD